MKLKKKRNLPRLRPLWPSETSYNYKRNDCGFDSHAKKMKQLTFSLLGTLSSAYLDMYNVKFKKMISRHTEKQNEANFTN